MNIVGYHVKSKGWNLYPWFKMSAKQDYGSDGYFNKLFE